MAGGSGVKMSDSALKVYDRIKFQRSRPVVTRGEEKGKIASRGEIFLEGEGKIN